LALLFAAVSTAAISCIIPNLSAGDLALEIDYGRDKPGDVLQRWDQGADGWFDYEPDGKQVTTPLDVATLVLGKYRLRSK